MSRANLYDYPAYYDLVYGSDWRQEVNFLLACCRKYSPRNVQRMFEPACGSGRLLFRLARKGLQVGGLDLAEPAVKYCNDRLERHGFGRSAFVGDMSDFKLRRPVDAAFNTINSFRHLTSARATRAHFRCMADALREGGLYILGLHLTPTSAEPMTEESWSAQRGQLSVRSHMWTIDRDDRRRRERIGVSLDVKMPTRRFQLVDELCFRTYTSTQFKRLLRDITDFECVGIYDFNYDIRQSTAIDSTTEDVIVVLQKTH